MQVSKRVKNPVNPDRPWLWLHEQEPDASGRLHEVNTIFLTGSECPFRCVMCDLWKNTLDTATPVGAIPRQIQWAHERLPGASVVKLYNSGNFFDRRAVPPDDYRQIGQLLSGYNRVIVENHPSLCNASVPEFRDTLKGTLEVAMGLETIHPEVLPALNKQMTTKQFADATQFLIKNNIQVRAFVLLNPPFLSGRDENIKWALKTIRFAFDNGVNCCSVIPTRPETSALAAANSSNSGNGAYTPPTIRALESVLEKGLGMGEGRVFADLWGLERFSGCSTCFEPRRDRLNKMNLTQEVLPKIPCSCKPI